MRSPGRSAPKSAATADPARTCSRDVRGSVTPYFANTYFVNPEQSNPWLGVLPPQTYLVPTYASAVRSTRDAAADGGGEFGMRRPRVEVVVVVVPPPPVVGMAEGILARTTDRTVSGDTPRDPVAQPVRGNRDTAAIAPTRGSDGVIIRRAKAGLAPTASRMATDCRATF